LLVVRPKVDTEEEKSRESGTGTEPTAMSAWRHVRAIALLPGTVALVVPALLVWLTDSVEVGWALPGPLGVLPVLLGAALIGAGLALWIRTVVLLARIGRGTLAPWDPTERLVVAGPYARVRHPMISAVLAILLGEAALLGSLPLLGWFAAFLAANAVWLPLVEEPGLARRFGPEYDAYREHVPRWLPRLRPWEPG
jgi:protein-S-isoprenylcysteine O-methyltransferase Ste14